MSICVSVNKRSGSAFLHGTGVSGYDCARTLLEELTTVSF
jgi:hypothetical protein